MSTLKGKHAVVTGGGRGIGRAIADALAREGLAVSIVSRTAESADGAFFKANADVTDQEQIDRAFHLARAANGPISILVNNSGIAESAPIGRTGRPLWDRIIATNLTGPFLCTRAVCEEMIEQRWGRIISIASIAGVQGAKYLSAYTASKHGVVGMTRALADELGAHGITVNAICPGWVDTEMLARAIRNTAGRTGMNEDQARARLAEMNPQQRILGVEEVAQAALSYCNSEANGQALILPGGEIL